MAKITGIKYKKQKKIVLAFKEASYGMILTTPCFTFMMVLAN